MPKNIRFIPKEPIVAIRIKEARRARGMTPTELANNVGVSRQSISKYELGSSEPSTAILEAIASTLNMPMSFFTKPEEPELNRGTIFFRSMKTNAARAKDIMMVKSTWATQIAFLLERDIVYPDTDIPCIPDEFCSSPEYSEEEIEDIASFVRNTWKLGNGPISNMSRLLESHGIIIATIKTGLNETDACSCYIGSRAFIFLDMEKECAVRTRFNLAHELGHLILHGEVTQHDIEDKKKLKQIEEEANRFASCFLLPRDSFLYDVRSTSLQSFLYLKRKWKVSIQAMVYRCKELNLFSENQMIYINKQISARRWRKLEPYDIEWPCESITILPTAVKMLIDRGDYSKEEFVSQFRIPGKDIEELCSLPAGYFSPKEKNAILIDFSSIKKTYDR